ncbi:hypothetical protein AYK21_02205 [Thermoplasmatales archaeon SG8-52-2]|nr:MAG: hypothetical protein AYK21_02205 [Thermoplasmatales archaeon SG8-52-2]
MKYEKSRSTDSRNSDAFNPSEEESVMNIIVGNDDVGLDHAKVTVDKAGVDLFINNVQGFQSWLEEARPFRDLKLTQEEKDAIKGHVNTIVVSLNSVLQANGYDPISSDWLYQELFETEPDRSTIVSMGVGYAYVPFYDYETFLGIMIRPIWLFYPPIFLGGGGYTGNFNINFLPGRVEFGDRLGFHIARTTVFSGLYINVGELGYDRIFGGMIMLLGRARVVMN